MGLWYIASRQVPICYILECPARVVSIGQWSRYSLRNGACLFSYPKPGQLSLFAYRACKHIAEEFAYEHVNI